MMTICFYTPLCVPLVSIGDFIDALQSYPKDATVLIDCEEYQDYDVDPEKDWQYLEQNNTLIIGTYS